jgi:hypothetical protein
MGDMAADVEKEVADLATVMEFVRAHSVPERCNALRTEPYLFGSEQDDELMLCELVPHEDRMHSGINAEGWRRWWEDRPSPFPMTLEAAASRGVGGDEMGRG